MNKIAQISYIGLGSNQGNSEDNLKQAIIAINDLAGVNVTKVSRVYRTEPQDDKNQPWFFNQVAQISCNLSPEELLAKLQYIENTLGRMRTERRYGPRTIDLDILLYGNIQVNSPSLNIPHPKMHERAFVLVPLAEIDPFLVVSDSLKVTDLLDDLEYTLTDDKIYQNL